MVPAAAGEVHCTVVVRHRGALTAGRTARLDPPPSLIDNQLRLAGSCMEYFSFFLYDSRNLSATMGDLSECVLAWNSLSPSGLCSWRERERAFPFLSTSGAPCRAAIAARSPFLTQQEQHSVIPHLSLRLTRCRRRQHHSEIRGRKVRANYISAAHADVLFAAD